VVQSAGVPGGPARQGPRPKVDEKLLVTEYLLNIYLQSYIEIMNHKDISLKNYNILNQVKIIP
jgi:hypothetical protein